MFDSRLEETSAQASVGGEMRLMRWSITRRLQSRGFSKSRHEKNTLLLSESPSGRVFDANVQEEENDFTSDGEESGGGGAAGEEAVDLTATRPHHGDDDDKDAEDPLEEDEEEGVDEQDEQEEDEEGSRKQIRHRQDAENNNNFVESGPASSLFPPAGTSHVTLEALQNTKVAVAQFAATALAGGADSEAALQDLAFLQSTLYTLQHQQVFQLQLISQLQQQLSITHGQPVTQVSTTDPADSKEASPSPIIHTKPLSTLTSPPTSRPPSHHQQTSPAPMTPNLHQERPTSTSSASPLNLPLSTASVTSTTATTACSQISQPHQIPHCSISSSLASSIITNTDPPPLHEPNTLEMLQKRAQEVLDNASQGLLANNLADELAFRSGKGSRLPPYDSKSSGRGEPFFKHRCRYCGKVFGSDSALQIHIRSHTGERPFKCNVCGSRFTTKGNLKVHFQRHTAKFPHVKMNPNPVPEHLDKYHPPLLQQIASGQRPMPSPPPPPPPSHHPSFHPAATHNFLPPQPPIPLSLTLPNIPPIYRPQNINHRDDQDVPENLSKPVTAAPSTSPHSPIAMSNSRHSFHDNHQQQQPAQQKQQQQLEQREEIKLEQRSPGQEQYQPRPMSQENAERITPKREPDETEEPVEEEAEDYEDTTRRYLNSPQSSVNPSSQPQTYEDCSMDSKISGRLEGDGDLEMDEETEEQPENLSGRGAISRLPQQIIAYPGASPASSSASSGSLQTSFAGILFPGPPAHHQIPHLSATTGGAMSSIAAGEMIDPAKDPAIYSSLLPRPGSNDNSWESLIEITKTSETSKLQQLVDNIEHKLTDPNQCVICHRVLSCKSALQMHYRTHTGERPFKCKICGRAFTTKGNLKTHMGVHRAKPPLRVLHQCPVCHKKFTNSLVLQQHIRLHTGEPTDLSPEQIQAEEVNEFPSGYHHHPLASFLPQAFPPLHPSSSSFLGFPQRQLTTVERQTQENDIEPKDEFQSQQQPRQQQQPQPRSMEDHSEEIEDQEEDEKDRREDDERCEVNRDRRSADVEEEQEHDGEDTEPKDLPMFSTSLAALENQVRTITTTATTTVANIARSPPYHRYNGSEKSDSPPTSGAPLDLTPRASSTPASVASASPTPPPQPAPHHPPHPFGMFAGLLQAVSSTPTTNTMGSSSINSIASMSAMTPGSGGSGPLASLTTSAVLAATSSYNPLGLAVGGSAVRGNTTCNICYKTFACNSALEIHYRSHTKERPFKCTICDRGFSTKNDGSGQQVCSCPDQPFAAKGSIPPQPNPQYHSYTARSAVGSREKPKRRRRRPEERKNRGRTGTGGGRRLTSVYPVVRLPPLMPPALGLLPSDHVFLGNMKQHMLTHKIRDMPPHLFSDTHKQQQHQQQPPPPPPPPPPPQQQQQQQQQQQSQDHETSRSPMGTDDSSLPPPPPPPPPMPPTSIESAIPIKRSPPDGNLPAPKRSASVQSKHLCQICNKNFSSSSALQIHMRTHTGDKPFPCHVCQKAFTTKGNLKVHLGTHMWSNGASRRGRRMSLDLPPLPITPKDSEFLQRRPDLFYPYLPAPFLNGVQQKLNEISVIQSNNGLPPHSVAAGKYANLFGSAYGAGGGGFPLDKQPTTASSNGPLVDGKSAIPSGSMLFQTSSPSHSPGTPSSNNGSQNSAGVTAWTAGDALQHHFERETPSRGENDATPPAARLPPPPTRGEGLAA